MEQADERFIARILPIKESSKPPCSHHLQQQTMVPDLMDNFAVVKKITA